MTEPTGQKPDQPDQSSPAATAKQSGKQLSFGELIVVTVLMAIAFGPAKAYDKVKKRLRRITIALLAGGSVTMLTSCLSMPNSN